MKTLTFDEEILKTHDLCAAVVMQYIQHWVAYNKEHNQNFRDGQYWTYATFEELSQSLYGAWSARKIKESVKELRAAGLIKSTGRYNQLKNIHTNWFTLVGHNSSVGQTKNVNPPTEKCMAPTEKCPTEIQKTFLVGPNLHDHTIITQTLPSLQQSGDVSSNENEEIGDDERFTIDYDLGEQIEKLSSADNLNQYETDFVNKISGLNELTGKQYRFLETLLKKANYPWLPPPKTAEEKAAEDKAYTEGCLEALFNAVKN